MRKARLMVALAAVRLTAKEKLHRTESKAPDRAKRHLIRGSRAPYMSILVMAKKDSTERMGFRTWMLTTITTTAKARPMNMSGPEMKMGDRFGAQPDRLQSHYPLNQSKNQSRSNSHGHREC